MAENQVTRYYLLATRAALDLLLTIAAPAALAVLARGLYREAEAATLIFGITLAVAFLLSITGGVIKAKRYGEEYKKLINSDR